MTVYADAPPILVPAGEAGVLTPDFVGYRVGDQPNVNYDKLTSTDVTVRLYGDAAVLTGRSGIVSNDASGTLAGETRWTRVFVHQTGGWKLVAFRGTLVRK